MAGPDLLPERLGESKPARRPRRKPRSRPIPNGPCPTPDQPVGGSTGDFRATTTPAERPDFAKCKTQKDAPPDRLCTAPRTCGPRELPGDRKSPRLKRRVHETNIGRGCFLNNQPSCSHRAAALFSLSPRVSTLPCADQSSLSRPAYGACIPP